jgi:uncharacterized membrane protein YhaH (DUF805 family)
MQLDAFERLYFSYEGRVNRATYWLAYLGLWIVILLIMVALSFFEFEARNMTALLVLLAGAVPGFSLAVKRAHDRDRSGWFLLVGVIPVIGPIWLLAELGLLRGTVGANKYGTDPLADNLAEA